MTSTAVLILTENEVERLATAVDVDPLLSGVALDAVQEGIDRWRVTLYSAEAPAAERLVACLRSLLGDRAPPPRFADLPDADWVAKSLKGLPPVRAGRFLVHGAHDRAQIRPNDIAIRIEAGQAFGTGHHGTTVGCLRAIGQVLSTRRLRNALDVGTGSGVLAIAIAKGGRIPVLASDIDPLAARIAAGNVRDNGVAGLVRIVAADGVARRVFRESGPYSLIVANILAGPLVGLAPSLRRLLAPGGVAILSGLTFDQSPRVASAYRRSGLKLLRAENIDGWVTLVLSRPSLPRAGRRPHRGKRAWPARSSALRS
jgi:ribosomal protein L11 methyltransferase